MQRRATRGAEESRVMNVSSFPHQLTRLVFDADQPYERFRVRLPAARGPYGTMFLRS
jgi:hypothetical protein